MIITVFLNFVLTAEYNIEGALIASIIGQLIFTIVLWYNLYIALFIKDKN